MCYELSTARKLLGISLERAHGTWQIRRPVLICFLEILHLHFLPSVEIHSSSIYSSTHLQKKEQTLSVLFLMLIMWHSACISCQKQRCTQLFLIMYELPLILNLERERERKRAFLACFRSSSISPKADHLPKGQRQHHNAWLEPCGTSLWQTSLMLFGVKP